MFCSGGNDNKLCIWKSGTQQTQLLGCIERQEDESTAFPHGSPRRLIHLLTYSLMVVQTSIVCFQSAAKDWSQLHILPISVLLTTPPPT